MRVALIAVAIAASFFNLATAQEASDEKELLNKISLLKSSIYISTRNLKYALYIDDGNALGYYHDISGDEIKFYYCSSGQESIEIKREQVADAGSVDCDSVPNPDQPPFTNVVNLEWKYISSKGGFQVSDTLGKPVGFISCSEAPVSMMAAAYNTPEHVFAAVTLDDPQAIQVAQKEGLSAYLNVLKTSMATTDQCDKTPNFWMTTLQKDNGIGIYALSAGKPFSE